MGVEGKKSLCFVQPDVKGWLVFFLRCIFSYCLINGMRGFLVSLFCYLFHREGSYLCFSCFQLGHSPVLSDR